MQQDLLFELAPAALVLLSHRQIQEANQAFLDLFGYDKLALIGQNMRILFPSDQDYEMIGSQAWQGVMSAQNGCYSDQRFMRHKEGQLFWVKTHARTLTPDDPFAQIIWHFEAETAQAEVQLTPREKEISQWVVNGYSCKQIAREMGLSHRTVEVHVANLKKKFAIHSKTQLAHKMIYSDQLN
jgi:PAS domain S-box-containing protein